MRILILGGTGWLGRTVASTAAAAGHQVTCLARGRSGNVPTGVRLVRADRDRPDAYREVDSQTWHGVIDVARDPGHVRGAVAALADRTERWVFVSTGNVYASHGEVGADEDADLLEPLVGDHIASLEEYGAAKVACEQAVLRGLPQAVLARAGLIGGPGDESGRSGYWPWRFAHPSSDDGAVLVPAAELETSMIDVRDLAAWLVRSVEDATITGAFDAIANRMPLADHLAVARRVAGHAGPLVSATDTWLIDEGVAEWAGPRSLPLWLCDPEWRGFAARRGSKVREHGLTPRPLAHTLADTLRWEEQRKGSMPHGAGLTDTEERELLAAASR